MENIKLIRLLRQLSESEIAAFKDFINSPYHNKNKKIALFFQDLVKFGLNTNDVPDKALVQKIAPSEKYKGSRLQDIMYRLINLLEDFLAEEKYRQNSFQRKINLMLIAYEKEMEPMIPGIEKDIELVHGKNPVRDSNYFYESFMIYSERDYSFRLLGKISDNDNLQNKADHLDLFYLASKLKDSCEMLNRSNIVSVKYGFKMLDSIIEYLLENPDQYINHPAINIYLNIYLMLSNEAHEKYFLELIKLAKLNEPCFSGDELRSIYAYQQNYCIRQINLGNTWYYEHLFEIYKHILANGLVFDDNKNMQWDFKNFVSLGLRLKEYSWTLEMINAFKEKLPAHIRQNAYTYNLANYYYETGEYKKATKLLNSVDFTDIYYNLDSKAMLLKIYYTVGEEESLYALVSSFGIYIRRNKLISDDLAEIYENLVRYTKKAFVLKNKLPYQRQRDYYKKVDTLEQKIKETKKIINISWLLEEVEKLNDNDRMN